MASKFNRIATTESAAPSPRRARARKVETVIDVDVVEAEAEVEVEVEDDESADESLTPKEISCFIAAAVQGFVTTYAIVSFLAAFIWVWLAVVIALAATLYIGNKFNKWFDVSGYDMCVSAVSKVGSLFTFGGSRAVAA